MTMYDAAYYREVGDWAERSAAVVVPMLDALLAPRSVVDVGCGEGAWAAAFAARGIADVHGVDGPHVDHRSLRIPAERFVEQDLATPLDLGRTFDLALCLEVAEHLPEAAAATLVSSLAALAPAVAFSAAVPHQGGEHHVNEQWPAYWADHFAAHGYRPVDCLRRRLWDDERVAWWYAQNLVLYVMPEVGAARPALTVGDGPPAALVHPTRYLEWVEWGIAIDAARGDVRDDPRR